MENRFSQNMSVIAGLVTWAAVGLPVFFDYAKAGPLGLFQGTALLWVLAYVSFGAIFILENSPVLRRLRPRFSLHILVIMTLLATICQLTQASYGLMSVLFIITAVEAAHIMPLRQGFAWVLGQSLIIFLSLLSSSGVRDDFLFQVILTMAYFGFQVFALFSTYATLSEAKAKLELAQVNAELRATQDLLTESSRMAERLRIARDLHDLIGHHLTALSLNLEVANHVAEGKAKEHIQQAHSLAKLLLSDVRDVVSTMRESDTIDLSRALSTLIEGIPSPAIHLEMPEHLELDDPRHAQVLLRCIQEVITNTIKHAHASNLWIKLERDTKGISVTAHDDGRGNKNLQKGNGLTGMQERLEQVGGKLKVTSSPGEGFQLSAQLPL
ncbi:MAG: sensor histidine kinase [Trueperaceae bacterium]|nr:sensor histidine kinase [Trueperaceae bacterium]